MPHSLPSAETFHFGNGNKWFLWFTKDQIDSFLIASCFVYLGHLVLPEVGCLKNYDMSDVSTRGNRFRFLRDNCMHDRVFYVSMMFSSSTQFRTLHQLLIGDWDLQTTEKMRTFFFFCNFGLLWRKLIVGQNRVYHPEKLCQTMLSYFSYFALA